MICHLQDKTMGKPQNSDLQPRLAVIYSLTRGTRKSTLGVLPKGCTPGTSVILCILKLTFILLFNRQSYQQKQHIMTS